MPGGVLVVGETPSLGRAIVELLEADGLSVQFVLDVKQARGRYPAVVAACNNVYCSTFRTWLRGELPDSELVVVGTRDPLVRSSSGVHQVDLPLRPKNLLAVVNRLL